jgi:hypothetical protein
MSYRLEWILNVKNIAANNWYLPRIRSMVLSVWCHKFGFKFSGYKISCLNKLIINYLVPFRLINLYNSSSRGNERKPNVRFCPCPWLAARAWENTTNKARNVGHRFTWGSFINRREFGSKSLFSSHGILKLNPMALVRKRTLPTERPPLVGEVSADFCG